MAFVIHDAAQQFIEQMGLVGERQGFPRINGRLLGFFLMYPEGRSLEELAELLEVSKASISTNARALEAMGMLERESHPGDRRDFYRLSRNPWHNAIALEQRRMREMQELFDEYIAVLPDELDEPRKRLADWKSFYEYMTRELMSQLEKWCMQHYACRNGHPS